MLICYLQIANALVAQFGRRNSLRDCQVKVRVLSRAPSFRILTAILLHVKLEVAGSSPAVSVA